MTDEPPHFEIAGRWIGDGYPPLVVAEIGINHNGSLALARTLVDAAVRAGAEVIKHQTHIVEDEMAASARDVIPGNADRSIYDIMEQCALSEEDERALKNHVESRGAIFISTPFSRRAVERLERLDVAAFKIGSGECNNYPLVERVAECGKPVILSTGMNDLDSVQTSVDIFRNKGIPFALLHCTNIYPTPPHLLRLEAIRELQRAFPDAVVGLSDHSLDNYACIGALALGANILERHFTDHKYREGPDISCSMTPLELCDLIEAGRVLSQARGGSKGVLKEEQSTIDFAYASVVATKDIRAGENLTEDNIWVKRPGTGDFPARDYRRLIGRKAAQPIAADSLLKNTDVSED